MDLLSLPAYRDPTHRLLVENYSTGPRTGCIGLGLLLDSGSRYKGLSSWGLGQRPVV